MSGECVISSILSHHNKDLKQQTKGLQLGYSSVLFSKWRKVLPWGVRVGWPQRRSLNPSCPLPFIHLSPCPTPSLPYVNKVSQEGGVFVSPEVLTLVCRFPFVPFLWPFSLSLSFRHHHFGLLFSSLTTWHSPPAPKRWEAQLFGNKDMKVSLATSCWTRMTRGVGSPRLASLKPQTPNSGVHLRVSDISDGQL